MLITIGLIITCALLTLAVTLAEKRVLQLTKERDALISLLDYYSNDAAKGEQQ